MLGDRVSVKSFTILLENMGSQLDENYEKLK